MNLKEKGKQLAMKMGRMPSTCAVKGCGGGDVEVVELKALDPIDHGDTLLQLCPHHREWAAERNALARDIKQELVERRRALGKEHFGAIQELAMPQDGKLREDILDGSVQERFVRLDDAFESEQ